MVGTFIQLDENIWPVGPFGVRDDDISKASTIKNILAWHEFIHTMAMP